MHSIILNTDTDTGAADPTLGEVHMMEPISYTIESTPTKIKNKKKEYYVQLYLLFKYYKPSISFKTRRGRPR